jgi:hypothetical protein
MMRWIAETAGALVATTMLSLWLILPVALAFYRGARLDREEKLRLESARGRSTEIERIDAEKKVRQWRSEVEGKGLWLIGALFILGSVLTGVLVEEAPHFARSFVATMRAPLD